MAEGRVFREWVPQDVFADANAEVVERGFDNGEKVLEDQ
jgi:hypothetical protein